MTPSDSHHRPTTSHKKRHSANRPALLRLQSANKAKVEITLGDDGDDVMSGFLQYCTTCEKQVPSNATLYCSEACRRKDNDISPNYPLFRSDLSTPSTPFSPTMTEPPFTSPDIVAPRLPSAHRNSNPFFSNFNAARLSPEVEVVQEGSISTRSSYDKSESEAARYLRQFGTSERSYTRQRQANSSSSAAPSLTSTPASSLSASTPYTPSSSHSRPLPHRGNPRGTSISFSNRSIDLVTPIPHLYTAPSSLDSTDTGSDRTITSPTMLSPPGASSIDASTTDLSYEKRTTIPGQGTSPGRSSLKTLFYNDGS